MDSPAVARITSSCVAALGGLAVLGIRALLARGSDLRSYAGRFKVLAGAVPAEPSLNFCSRSGRGSSRVRLAMRRGLSRARQPRRVAVGRLAARTSVPWLTAARSCCARSKTQLGAAELAAREPGAAAATPRRSHRWAMPEGLTVDSTGWRGRPVAKAVRSQPGPFGPASQSSGTWPPWALRWADRKISFVLLSASGFRKELGLL